MKNRNALLAKLFLIAFTIAVVVTGGITITSLTRMTTTTSSSILYTISNSLGHNAAYSSSSSAVATGATPIQILSVLYYATSPILPEQTLAEIRVTFDLLALLSPCNFLVFGLGHESLMWSSFNPRGITLFLEEDVRLVQRTLKDAPSLRVQTVRYPTYLSDADNLLSSYRFEPLCLPPDAHLRANVRCKLALSELPDDVYDRDWDVIMIDGPKNDSPNAPGRMSAIFSAALMARSRVRHGVTHVIVHDVDRKVEKMFAEEFLCEKYLVKSVGKLWHFEIPADARVSGGRSKFC